MNISSGARFLACASLLGAASVDTAMAQQVPDFGSNEVGWVSAGDLVTAAGQPADREPGPGPSLCPEQYW